MSKISMKITLALAILVCNVTSNAQIYGRISGIVLDKMSQKPLGNVSVSLAATNKGVITDSTGSFRLTEIDLKTYNIEFSLVGYKQQTLFNIVVNSGNENTYTVELEPNATALNEVVVKSNKRTVKAATLETPLSVQRLTSEEIKSNPGGNFDISKVIQTLPGVGGGQSGGGFRNDIIIRGGAPNENVFYLDGIEIPVINHFQTQGSAGGPQGILNVSFIEDVRLSSSAFDSRYDNALSSVFQFKQRNGNPNNIQGNFRLSATEAAATLEGPLSKDKKTTFLASVRRSYLQLLFRLLDLSVRPNYWDIQTKITRQINKKTTLSLVGLGAIDEFRFVAPAKATPEKLYDINSNPIINQRNYTAGITLKRLIKDGFINASLSRNSFDNDNKRYEDNSSPSLSNLTLLYKSNETENKFRIDVNKNSNGWKWAFGALVQLSEYSNTTYHVVRKEIKDSTGAVIQPSEIVNFKSPLKNFWKAGVFAQAGKRYLNNRLGISMGVRTDMNSFTTNGTDAVQTISPRLSLSYVLTDKWTINASVGRYYKIAPYTILGFADNAGTLINKNSKYLRNDHFVAGIEYLPGDQLRCTVEGFYKQYANVPISIRDGVSLSNLGSNFNILGNEAVSTTGKGRAYGVEFFAQKKLTKRSFGILSYTYYESEYTGFDSRYLPSSWDNRHLLSITFGYKFPRNWELGLKFRYQGGAPYTPYNKIASRINYLSLGQGILDYSKLNQLRSNGFNSGDVRIDKKWNLKKTTIDLFLDVTNWYGAKNVASPTYTFKRTADNTAFLTTNGSTIKPDGSNAIPYYLENNDVNITPTIGFIIEF